MPWDRDRGSSTETRTTETRMQTFAEVMAESYRSHVPLVWNLVTGATT